MPSLESLRTGKAQSRVIGRGQCRYRHFDLAGTPAGERRGLLDIKLTQWSPFRLPGRCVVFKGDQAMVWIWDRDTAQGAAPSRSAKKTPLPETLLHPPLEETGCRLVQCAEGVEGQYWQAGVLTASYWWPEVPTENQWHRFQRGASIPPSPLPGAVQLAPLNKPWAKCQREGFAANAGQTAVAFRVLWLLFVGLLGWQLTDAFQWSGQERQLKSDIERLTQGSEDILQARSQALESRRWLEAYARHSKRLSQLTMARALIAELPEPEQAQILSWQFVPGGLEVVLQGQKMDPANLARSYQKLAWVEKVVIEPERKKDTLRVKIDLHENSE